MSLHHSFGHTRHPGFASSIDPRTARRQLHVSLAVVAVLILAIGGSAFAIRPASGFDQQSVQASIAASQAVNHHLLNAEGITRPLNGG